jgi:uncharacterized membrane protein
MTRGRIVGTTLSVILPTFLPGFVFLFIIFFNRISSIDDNHAIYTNVDVGFVLVIGSVASTFAPLLFRIPDSKNYVADEQLS